MKLWELFQGYELAYGTYDVKKAPDERGKVDGRAHTYRQAISQADWDQHISGNGVGVGVIPLRKDNTITWAAIDIDVNKIDHAKLEREINKFGLPLIVARSKSGGAHCFVFFKEPVLAEDVVYILASWASALGHGGCEVFPKQVSRYSDDDVGNWLNMPYYQADLPTRYAIRDGKRLSLDDFCAYAESKMVTLEQVQAIKPLEHASSDDDENDLLWQGPPCLKAIMAKGGFSEGTRNDGMYNVAVYLRLRYPDNWADKITVYNTEMCDPPLSLSELQALVKGVGRKDYSYGCKKAPIAAFCNKRVCRGQSYGIGEGTSADFTDRVDIGGMIKCIGDPVLWYLSIAGKRMQFTTEELMSQTKFRIKVTSVASYAPPRISDLKYNAYINRLMAQAQETEAPFDASPLGHFETLLDLFINGQAQATAREELYTRGLPYREGTGVVYFRSDALFAFLKRHNFAIKGEHDMWQMLRQLDIGAKSDQISIKGRARNVWVIPDHAENPVREIPKFGTEEF